MDLKIKMFKPKRMEVIHKETVTNCDKAVTSLSNLLLTLSNDTSLALYRIQDHSNNKIKKLVLEIKETKEINKNVEESVFDARECLDIVSGMSRIGFGKTMEMIQNVL
ncbi:hypothetical protein HDV06_004625 [Boothiomyces sp. JEL0866]|nr:hypothetical protein HDV06_004625 [Boothiomyces sp. JEL0866]